MKVIINTTSYELRLARRYCYVEYLSTCVDHAVDTTYRFDRTESIEIKEMIKYATFRYAHICFAKFCKEKGKLIKKGCKIE